MSYHKYEFPVGRAEDTGPAAVKILVRNMRAGNRSKLDVRTAMKSAREDSTVRDTRFAELGYERHAPTLWRIIDKSTGAAVGPHYKTQMELLADLDRYATEVFGATLVQPRKRRRR